jgi:hypothetical protein
MQVEMIIVSLVASIGIIVIIGLCAWVYYFKYKDLGAFKIPTSYDWVEVLNRIMALEKVNTQLNETVSLMIVSNIAPYNKKLGSIELPIKDFKDFTNAINGSSSKQLSATAIIYKDTSYASGLVLRFDTVKISKRRTKC